MKKLGFWLLPLLLCACASDHTEQKDSIAEHQTPEIPVSNVLKISDEYSYIKNEGKKDIPYFIIPTIDSFIVDISDYNFDASAVFHEYMTESRFRSFIGGSWSHFYVDIDDTTRMSIRIDEELLQDSIFKVAPVLEYFDGSVPNFVAADMVPDDFMLSIGLFIDNGRGMVEVDRFRVKVEE